MLLQKNSLKKDIFLFSALFAITALGCYLFFALNGKTFVKYGNNIDGFTQIIPAYTAIKHMIADLFAGKGIAAWNWSLGLGGDTFEYFGCKLFNPFTYLIIAFPERLIDLGYTLVCIIKQYFAGLAFLLCMRKCGLNRNQTIVGALSYAFSGWLIGTALSQGSFENAAILLPLLVMGTEKVFRKESPILFIISVAYCVASGVTWAYICGIVIVIYYLARYHDYHSGEGLESCLRNIGQYVLYGFIGILISAPFVLSIISSMTGATTNTGANSRIWFYAIEKYFSVPEGLFKLSEVGPVSYSFIYISIVCVMLIPMLVNSLRKKSTIAWLACGFAVLAIFPITSKAFNGFSYAAGRWYFVIAFFMIWATIECLNNETLSDARNLAIMLIWIIVLATWTILMYVTGYGSKSGVAAAVIGTAFGLTIIALIYFRFIRKKEGRAIEVLIAAVCVLAITCPVNIKACPLVSDYLDEFLEVGEAVDRFATSSERTVSEINDSSFYRVDQGYRLNKNMSTKLKPNANIFYNNRSIYTYSSLVDSDWNKLNKIVGNNYGYFARVAVLSNDNRSPMDCLLGVKYFLGNNEYEVNASEYAGYGFKPYTEVDGVDVLKNQNTIGLGAAFNQYITESELMTLPQLVRDQAMMQVAVIPDDEAGKMSKIEHADINDIQTTIKELQYTKRIEKNKITLEPETADNCMLMVSIEDLVKKTDGSIEDRGNFTLKIKYGDITKYSYCEKNSRRGFNDISEYNINLGYKEHHSGNIEIIFRNTGDYDCTAIKVYAIPTDQYQMIATNLCKNSIDVVNFDDKSDVIEGTLTTDESSIIYTSVPYKKGWTAYVDGEPATIIKNTDIAFTGIMVGAGEHTIRMEYSPWGMGYALTGTFIGIASLIYIAIRRKNESIACNKEEI